MAVSDPRIMEHMFSEIGLVGEERTQQQGSNPLQVGLRGTHRLGQQRAVTVLMECSCKL